MSERYAVQARVGVLGAAGDRRLRGAACAVVGVGATGGAVADQLARAGVGRLRLIDRDVVELSNLHRQVLFDEQDVRDGLPKAEAARRRLARVNSEVRLEGVVADLHGANAERLLDGVDVVVDGTDTFAARLVINDACAALGRPWVHTGVVGTRVQALTIRPGSACLRCYLGGAPAPGSVATCETEGVLGPTVLVAAGLAATAALELLARDPAAAPPPGPARLTLLDAWTRAARTVDVPRDPDCPTCAGDHRALLGAAPAPTEELCGRDAVIVRGGAPVALPGLASRLARAGRVAALNEFLLRFEPDEPPRTSVTLFADGRALVRGARDAAAARTLVARYVGG